MKIYVSHSRKLDYVHDLYEPLKASSLYPKHEFFLPHDAGSDRVKTKEIIQTAGVLVAEISYPSTSQGIELGWADAAGIRIICLYPEGTKYQASIRFICPQPTTYTSAHDLIKKLTTLLANS